MTNTWILTANASRASVYSVPRAKLLNDTPTLQLVSEYSNPEGRKKSGDLIADKPGNYHYSKGGYGTFVDSSEAKKVELDRFAKKLAEDLKKACNDHCFDDLILIAAPSFHGMLNKHIKQQAINGTISIDVEKDYTQCTARELVGKLQGYL